MAQLDPINTALTDPQVFTADGQTAQAKPMADLVLGVQFAAAVQRSGPFRRYKIHLPDQCPGPRGPNPEGGV